MCLTYLYFRGIHSENSFKIFYGSNYPQKTSLDLLGSKTKGTEKTNTLEVFLNLIEKERSGEELLPH